MKKKKQLVFIEIFDHEYNVHHFLQSYSICQYSFRQQSFFKVLDAIKVKVL